MKRIAIAVVLVVGVVAVGLFTGCRKAGPSFTKKGKPDVDVELTMQNGLCQVKRPVDDLGGEKDKQISWTVTNVDCDIPQYVTFSEYREHLAGGGYGPIDTGVVDPNLASSKQIERGKNDNVKAKIAKEIKNPNPDKLFKYKICTGPSPNPTVTCLDPDVDVWPF
jgi:hypothetical protein